MRLGAVCLHFNQIMGFDFLESGNLSRSSKPLIPYMVSLLNVLNEIATRKENSLATPCNRALINRPKRARVLQSQSSFRTGKRHLEDQRAGLFKLQCTGTTSDLES